MAPASHTLLKNTTRPTDTTSTRILRFLNGAPRTWLEIVSTLAGVSDAARLDLPTEDAARVHGVCVVLATMTREGKLVRTCATDPRHDRYAADH